MRVFKDGEIEK